MFLVAQVKLNRACVLAGVGQIKARRVLQHVGMDWKLDVGRLGGFSDHVMHRCAASSDRRAAT